MFEKLAESSGNVVGYKAVESLSLLILMGLNQRLRL